MSDSDSSDGFCWPRCTCNRKHGLDIGTSDDDYTDEDSSYIDEESEDESLVYEKFFFISVYKHDKIKNSIIISEEDQIKEYRLKYLNLIDKSINNVTNIWGNVIVSVPVFGFITLKFFAESWLKESKKRKILRKPYPSMKLENIDNTDKIESTGKSCERNIKEKENNNLNKNNIVRKVQVANTNVKSQSEDKNTNIKKENKSDINNKILQAGNKADKKVEPKINTPTKSKELSKQTIVTNTKSSANKAQKNNIPVNNITVNVNQDQKSNSANNISSKINLENKNSNKNGIKMEEKSKCANQNSTPKKSNMVNNSETINLANGKTKINGADNILKVNTPNKSNKNETKNSANSPKNSSVADKLEKKDLLNTPSKKTKTVDKTNQTNSGVNKDSTKQTVPEFKKPLDVKSTLNNTVKSNTIINGKITCDFLDTNENNVHDEILDKAIKKKLKKQKQKVKKMERNRKDSSSNCSTSDMSVTNSSPGSVINKKINKSNTVTPDILKKSNKTQAKKYVEDKNNIKVDTEESEFEKNEDHLEYGRTSDDDGDDVDFLTDNENLPAFLVKLKEKSKSKEKAKKVKPDASTKINSNSNNNTGTKEEFMIYSVINKKPNKDPRMINNVVDENGIFYSDSFGEYACHMIFENNFIGALEYLGEAINFNYIDQRHYLNRCYCYLSSKKNALALADAKYILQNSTNIGYVFIANVRAAQASYALHRYDEAEVFIKEAIRINPTSVFVERELILIQVAKIVSMGFNEKDALLALEKYSSVQGAVNYLTENTSKSNISKKKYLGITLKNCYEFEYSSDEDEPSNAEIVNRMLNYEPGTAKFQHIISKPSNPNLIVHDNSKGMKDKKVLANGKVNSRKSKSIWVGSLTNSITDTVLKKSFKKFGKVISIYRPLNEGYAFINFEKSEDVTNVLTNSPYHEVAGQTLPVRSTGRQK